MDEVTSDPGTVPGRAAAPFGDDGADEPTDEQSDRPDPKCPCATIGSVTPPTTVTSRPPPRHRRVVVSLEAPDKPVVDQAQLVEFGRLRISDSFAAELTREAEHLARAPNAGQSCGVDKKRWSDLNPRVRQAVLLGGAFEAGLKIAALIDLSHRSRGDIRGSKTAWALALALVSSGGVVPIVYMLRGRRIS